ncbi:MAG: Crp/Fnr family transcriptional regulator [Planctomycetes bacterium]|nr:Crp/Fnr family transcriptional regulator [Planctomycetota bacterium]MCL4729108.1 Crp/Fnr family transcriptional regulator [Planctomycetota bacterium]
MHATELLRDVPLFKNLSDETTNQLEARLQVKRVEEGESLLSAGAVPRTCWVVLSGQVKLYRVNRAGKEQVFAYLKPGEVFGLSVLTDPQTPVTMGAVARTATEIAEIDAGMLRDLLKREPAFALAVLAEQNRRLRQMTELVDQLSLKDAHNRLARWLDHWISQNQPSAGEGELMVVLPYTQSEIAAQIGTVREVVSRGFSRMEKDGILRASGKRVTLMSRKRLRQMADE